MTGRVKAEIRPRPSDTVATGPCPLHGQWRAGLYVSDSKAFAGRLRTVRSGHLDRDDLVIRLKQQEPALAVSSVMRDLS